MNLRRRALSFFSFPPRASRGSKLAFLVGLIVKSWCKRGAATWKPLELRISRGERREEELEETSSTHGSEVTTVPRDGSKTGRDELENLGDDLDWNSRDHVVLEEGKERKMGGQLRGHLLLPFSSSSKPDQTGQLTEVMSCARVFMARVGATKNNCWILRL